MRIDILGASHRGRDLSGGAVSIAAHVIPTSSPRAANATALARPMPESEPVTIATLAFEELIS